MEVSVLKSLSEKRCPLNPIWAEYILRRVLDNRDI